MSFGRAMLLGLALASAVAAQLAAGPIDAAAASASITATDDGGQLPTGAPPGFAIAPVAPALPVVVVAATPAQRVTAPTLPAAAPPIWFAPKTSPPQA